MKPATAILFAFLCLAIPSARAGDADEEFRRGLAAFNTAILRRHLGLGVR